MVRYALLSGAQSFLTLAFYVGALVFVLTRRSRLSARAARLAIWSVGLMLASWVLSVAWPLAYGRYAAGLDGGLGVVTVLAMFSSVTAAIHLAAIVLLLMALFSNNPAPADWPAEMLPGPADLTVMPASAPGSQAAPGGIPPWPIPGQE